MNSYCVLNPNKVPKQTCPNSGDVCSISASYVKPNKSVDYDEKRDLRNMKRGCRSEKSMCNIGVKPWGKCYQSPSETELICETCCNDDLCNTGDLTWKTSNAALPKSNGTLPKSNSTLNFRNICLLATLLFAKKVIFK